MGALRSGTSTAMSSESSAALLMQVLKGRKLLRCKDLLKGGLKLGTPGLSLLPVWTFTFSRWSTGVLILDKRPDSDLLIR